MVGIGPFVPHHDTRFKDEPAGTVELTVFLLSLIRIMKPNVLPPGNYCSWNDRSGRKGKRNFSGSQCYDAESFTGYGKEKL